MAEETYDSLRLNSSLRSLPPEILGRIITYSTTPLQRQQVIDSLHHPKAMFPRAERFSSWIWSKIFKPDSWPDQIQQKKTVFNRTHSNLYSDAPPHIQPHLRYLKPHSLRLRRLKPSTSKLFSVGCHCRDSQNQPTKHC